MGKKRLSLLLALTIFLTFSTGCWDRHELEEMAYIVALGVELAPDKQDRIITAQFVVPSKMAGGGSSGGGDEKSFYQITVKSRSIFGALDILQSTTARRFSLMQCRAVFVSEDLARQSLQPFVGVVTRYPDLRRNLFVCIVPGSTQEFLEKNSPKLQPVITKYYEEIAQANEYNGYTTTSTFQKLQNGMVTPGENALLTLASLGKASAEDKNESPVAGEVPRTGGTRAEFVGMAVIKGDKMVGKLSMEEGQIVNMLRGDWSTGPFVVKDPDDPRYTLGLTLRQAAKPEIKVELTSDPVQLEVRLNFNGTLISQFSTIDYTQPEARKRLDSALAEELEDRARGVIDRAQGEFNSDIFRFGNVAVKKKFLTWQEWLEFNWPERFPQADIRVSAKVTVRWFGLSTSPAVQEVAP